MLFAAAVLGTGGGIAFISNDPDVRADPFTGTMGQNMRQEIYQYIDAQIDDLQDEVIENTRLNVSQNEVIARSALLLEQLERRISDSFRRVDRRLEKSEEHVKDHDAESHVWKQRILENQHDIEDLKNGN